MNATQLLAHFDRLAEAPNAVPRLRRFILDLAVRGKLVEQDAGDESASKLLNRIQAEKSRLVHDRLLRSEKELPPITEAEMRLVLPPGWTWARLGSLSHLVTSGSRDWAKYYSDAGPIFVRMGNLSRDSYRLRMSNVQRVTPPSDGEGKRTSLQGGDILISITGEVGLLGLIPPDFGEAYINQHTCMVRPSRELSSRFLPELFRSSFAQDQFNAPQRGLKNSFRLTDVTEFVVPLPPLAEQHRIVVKVDELMALCDQLEAAQQERERRRDRLAAASLQRLNQPAADTTPGAQREYARFHLQNLPRLTTRPEHIKAMRQTFFNLAVCGKLVDQKSDEEPVGKLLKQLGVQTQKDAIAPNSPTIPTTWALLTIEQIANVSSGTTPSRDVAEYYVPDGTSWVTSGETSNAFITETAQHVSEKALKETSLKLYPPGTLIVAMYGQGKTRGQVAELSITATTNQACAAIVLKLEDVGHRRFVKLFFKKIYEEIRELAAGGAQPNLNGGKIKATLIPFPPLAEQLRIVAKVDELMILCDQLEAQLTTTQTESRRLLEAVLEAALTPV